MNDVIYDGLVRQLTPESAGEILSFLVTKEANGYALWKTVDTSYDDFVEVFVSWFHAAERDEALETAVQLTVEARAKLDEMVGDPCDVGSPVDRA